MWIFKRKLQLYIRDYHDILGVGCTDLLVLVCRQYMVRIQYSVRTILFAGKRSDCLILRGKWRQVLRGRMETLVLFVTIKFSNHFFLIILWRKLPVQIQFPSDDMHKFCPRLFLHLYLTSVNTRDLQEYIAIYLQISFIRVQIP